MKGKKFAAAEKHFEKKETKLRQEIKLYMEQVIEINNANRHLSKENELLKSQNAKIMAKYEKLLEYSKLKESDIADALQKDKALVELSRMFEIWRGSYPIEAD